MSVAELVAARPELRGLDPHELGAEIGVSPEDAAAGIAAAFAALTGHAPTGDPSLASFDTLTILLGDPHFVLGHHAGATTMHRQVFVPHPEYLEYALLLRPDLAPTPWVRHWRAQNGVAIAKTAPALRVADRSANGPLRIVFEHAEAGDIFDLSDYSSGGSPPPAEGGSYDTFPTKTEDTTPAWGPADYTTSDVKPDAAPAPSGGTMAKNWSRPIGTPGLYQSAPDKQWIFNILNGWSPRAYAAAITGNENRARELIDLNAAQYGTVGTPGTLAYNLKSFKTGNPLTIPQAWNQYISQDGDWGTKGTPWPAAPSSPAPVPDPKPVGMPTPYTVGLPDGQIASVKTQLGALAVKYPAMGIVGYPGPYDLNDTIDEAFIAAVSKFQQWANAQSDGPTASTVLRTDGKLDEATHARINAWTKYAAESGVTPTPATTGPVATSPWGTWPTGVPGVPPGYDPTKAKELTPDVKPGSVIAGSNQIGSGGGDGGGGLALPLAIAFLAWQGF